MENNQNLIKIAQVVKEHAKKWYLKKMAALKIIDTIDAYKEAMKN